MNNKCVYLHKDKEGIVRYVGSGTKYRAYLTYAKSCRGKSYADYVEANGNLEVYIVAEGLSKLEAENLERELYDKYSETILNYNRPSSVKSMTKEMFEQYLYYDESSKTCLRWKVNVIGGKGAIRIKADFEAGSLNTNGYYEVGIQGVRYRAHRIVALLHGFEVEGFVVDHKDRNRSNNNISNLRVVSQKENSQNLSLSSNNKSGVQGVSYNKLGYWIASWCEGGKRKLKHFSIKKYTSLEEAFEAAVEYRKQMTQLHYN